jgi:uncharacterized coiled-coil protein SlyX
MATYKIATGDTLSKLASKNKTTIPELLRLNPTIKNPNLIYAGQNLNLPDATPASTLGSTPITGTSPITGGEESPLKSVIKSKTESTTSPRDTLLSRMTSAVSGMQAFDPVARKKELEQEQGVTSLNTQVGSFEQEIAKTQSLLDSLETDIKARTPEFVIPEEARRRVLASEQNPLIKQLSTLESGYGTATSELTRRQAEVTDILGLEKEKANQPLNELLTELNVRSQIDQMFPDRERLTPLMEVIATGDTDPASIYKTLQDNGVTDIGSDEIIDTLSKLTTLSTSQENLKLNREQFEEQKREFGLNYALEQRKLTETINDRISKSLTDNQEKKDTVEEQIISGQQLFSDIGDLVDDPGLPESVGGTFLTRTRLNPFSDQRSNFIASVQEVTSKLTLNNLIDSKKQGATFGALSEGELGILAGAATKLAKLARNEDGQLAKSDERVAYYDVSEKVFKEELNKIRNLVAEAVRRKGGTINMGNDDISEVDNLFGNVSGGSEDFESLYK